MAIYTRIIYCFNEILRIFPLNILPPLDSIRHLIEQKVSLSRYGDGELMIIMGGDIHFQQFNEKLKNRLLQILMIPETPGFKIGIPIYINSLKQLSRQHYDFWNKNMKTGRMHWLRFCRGKSYLDSQFTWTYILEKNRSLGEQCLETLPMLWQNQELLIVEGSTGGLGVHAGYLNNAKSISRIVCPSSNAWDRYDEILASIQKHSSPGHLVLLSLGPTATVLAYDLFLLGIWAVDIGHIDRSYQEYYSTKMIQCNGISKDDYEMQIIERIR